MWTLRIVLIALGALFVLGVYLYTRRHPPRPQAPPQSHGAGAEARHRAAPAPAPAPLEVPTGGAPPPAGPRDGARGMDGKPTPAVAARPAPAAPAATPAPARADARRIFLVAACWPGQGVSPGKVADQLVRAGCTAGEDRIFHRLDSEGRQQFSVADLFEPGVLHPRPPDKAVRGLVFFFEAEPGPDARDRLDRMIGSARDCALAFGGHVEDDEHRPLTAARELALKVAAAGERSSA